MSNKGTEQTKLWAPLTVAGGVRPANVWATRFGDDTPEMSTMAMQVPAPQVKETRVFRVKLDREYVRHEKMWRVVNDEVAGAIYNWLKRSAQTHTGDVVSVFKVFRDTLPNGGQRLRALVRLNVDITSKVLSASGTYTEGAAAFFDPFAWDEKNSAEPLASPPNHYFVKEEAEDKTLDYLKRGAEGRGGYGLDLGDRQVAQRLSEVPGQRLPAFYNVDNVPRDRMDTDLENVLVAGGFEGPAVVGRPYATKGGYRWRFKASAATSDDFYSFTAGEERTLVVTKVNHVAKGADSRAISARHWKYENPEGPQGQGTGRIPTQIRAAGCKEDEGMTGGGDRDEGPGPGESDDAPPDRDRQPVKKQR